MIDSDQPKILIYHGGGISGAQTEISEILELGLTTVITSQLQDLEQLLRTSRFDILIWIFDPASNWKLEACLQKSRNFSQVRPLKILVLAKAMNRDHIDRVLQLGALWIYSNSARVDRWLPVVREILGLQSGMSLPRMIQLDPLEVEIHCFSRIGKMHFHPAGALTVESNLQVKTGEMLKIQGAIADSLSGVNMVYGVKGVHQSNLYYRYKNRIELQPLFNLSADDWQAWVQNHSTEWAVPKSKILWITSQYVYQKEVFFDKTLFSVYSESPQSLNAGVLARLSPRIILLDDSIGDTEGLLENWIKAQPSGSSVLLIRNGNPIKCFGSDGLTPEFTQVLKTFLTQRILHAGQESKFLSRNSRFSRISFMFAGVLNEASSTHCSLLSRFDFKVPAVIGIRMVDPRAQVSYLLYARVMQSEFLADHVKYRLHCEWIPNGDTFEEIIPDYKKLLK